MYRIPIALALLLLLVACGGGGGNKPTNPNPSNPPNPTGSFPAELSGVWQDTLASSGNFAGTKRYNLKPLTAYYKFGFTESVGFQLGCEWPQHRWQFAVCVNRAGWNSYRKRQ